MLRRPNTFWDISVGSALNGSVVAVLFDLKCNGPGTGLEEALLRPVGDDGRVRAGVPGNDI